MKREFLQNFKVGDQPLTKEIIDAIMAENGRDVEAATESPAGHQKRIFDKFPSVLSMEKS